MEHLFLKLLVTFVAVHSVTGLLVLDAPHLILSQKPDTYAAYFADGQNTLEAFFGLPRCEVFGGGSGEYLELYNVNASLPVEHRGSFDNGPRDSTSVQWNYTAFPMLDPSFTGLYRCRTNGITSKATYQLNVRTNLHVSCPASVHLNVNETMNLSITVTHSLPATLNVSPLLGYLTSLQMNNASTEYFMTIMGNESRLRLGKSVSVTWNATYYSKECSGVSGKPSVRGTCQAISTSASCTTNVYTFRFCPTRVLHGIDTPIPSYQLTPPFTLKNVGCRAGFVLSATSTVRNVSCLANGTWKDFPRCENVNECNTDPCPSAATCMATVGSFKCLCPSGFEYNNSNGICEGITQSSVTVVTTERTPTSACTASCTCTCANVLIASAAVGCVASIVLLSFLAVIMVKLKKAMESLQERFVPREALATDFPAALNVSYEGGQNVAISHTSSDAYGLHNIPDQPNYEFIKQ